MNKQAMTNTVNENFIVNELSLINSGQVSLALVNRNTELKLGGQLTEMKKEMANIESILMTRGEASGVYTGLLATLEREVIKIDELFEAMLGLDDLEISLILEKIKKKILCFNQKMDVLARFVYNCEEMTV